MENQMKLVKTLSNSSGPARGEGIPNAVAEQRLDQGFFSSTVKRAEERSSTVPQHHEMNLFSTLVG